MRNLLIGAVVIPLLVLAQPGPSPQTPSGRSSSSGQQLCCFSVDAGGAVSTADLVTDGGCPSDGGACTLISTCPALASPKGRVLALQCSKGLIVFYNGATDGGRNNANQTRPNPATTSSIRANFETFDDPVRVDLPANGSHLSVLCADGGGTCCLYDTGFKPVYVQ